MESVTNKLKLIIEQQELPKSSSTTISCAFLDDLHELQELMRKKEMAPLRSEQEKRLRNFIGEKKKVLIKFNTINTFFEEIYELLEIILTSFISEQRHLYFHDVLDFYWDDLNEKYKNNKVCLTDRLPRELYENFVKILLPYVKIDMAALELLKKDSDLNFVSELLEEIDEYLQKPYLLLEDYYRIVQNHVGNKNFKLLNYQLKFLEERPGYLGDYCNVKVCYSYQNQDHTINIFCKFLPSTEPMLRRIAHQLNEREEFFYGEYLNKLDKLGFTDVAEICSKCFFIRKKNVIVLEDLSIKGYYSRDIKELADPETILMLMKSIAKIHASSVFLEEKLSTAYGKSYRLDEEYEEYLYEPVFTHTRSSGAVMSTASRYIHEYFLDHFPDIPKKMSLKIFKRKVEKTMQETFVNIHNCSKYRKVLSHGDLWAANYMCKKNKHGELDSVLLVDYQTLRYAPPAVDVLFAIYMSLSRRDRNIYQEAILNEYYKDLKNILHKYDININRTYPIETFWDSVNYYKPFAICMTLCYIQTLTLPKEVLEPIRIDKQKLQHYLYVDRISTFDEAMKYDSYRMRMRELVENLYEVICIE